MELPVEGLESSMSLAFPIIVPRKVKPADLHMYSFNHREIGGPTTRGFSVAIFLGIQAKEASYQAPLEAFKAWYEDFPFSEFLKSQEKVKVGWECRVTFLFPAIQVPCKVNSR